MELWSQDHLHYGSSNTNNDYTTILFIILSSSLLQSYMWELTEVI